MKALIAAITMLVGGTQALSAQTIAGEWSGTMNTPGAQVPLSFTLMVKGDSLSGTVKRTAGDVALKGRVKGDSVSFSYTILYNDNPFPLSLRGRVVKDSLTGMVDFGGGNEDSFEAKRVVAKPDTTRAGRYSAGGGRH